MISLAAPSSHLCSWTKCGIKGCQLLADGASCVMLYPWPSVFGWHPAPPFCSYAENIEGYLVSGTRLSPTLGTEDAATHMKNQKLHDMTMMWPFGQGL